MNNKNEYIIINYFDRSANKLNKLNNKNEYIIKILINCFDRSANKLNKPNNKNEYIIKFSLIVLIILSIKTNDRNEYYFDCFTNYIP